MEPPSAVSPTPPPTPPPPAPRSRMSLKFVLALALLLAAVFVAGYLPATIESRRSTEMLTKAQLDLRLASLHRKLGVASHEAHRNNFANAAAAANEFFDECRALASSGLLTSDPRTHAAISTYATYDSEISALLAQADPQVKERLNGLYLAMDGVLQRRP